MLSTYHLAAIKTAIRNIIQPDAEGKWGVEINGQKFFFSKKEWLMPGVSLLLTTPTAKLWDGEDVNANNILCTCGDGWVAVTDDTGNVLE